MNRSSYLGVDQAFFALQGYAGAYLFNAIQNTTVINPVNAAIGFAGFSYLETVIRQLTKSLLKREESFRGPIPTGKVTIVSYSLASYATFKAMELAGLIATVPTAAKVVGVLGAVGLLLLGGSKLAKRLGQTMQAAAEYSARPERANNRERQNLRNNDDNYSRRNNNFERRNNYYED